MSKRKILSPPRGPDSLTKKQVKEAVRKVTGKPKPKYLNRIQILNPKTDRYVKINTETGVIMHHKKTPGPFKNIAVVILGGE